MTLTSRQSEVLEFIRGWIGSNGFAPSVRDIGEYFGWGSTQAVMCHLKALKKKGAIDWQPGLSRSIRVKKNRAEFIEFLMENFDAKQIEQIVLAAERAGLV